MEWDLEDIRSKRDKLKAMINDELDKESREIIVSSYFANDGMLNNSGSIRYTHFYNAINLLTFNKFHLVKEKERRKIYISAFYNNGIKFELTFLNKINNLFLEIFKNKVDMTYPIFSKTYITDNKLIEYAKDFYKNLDFELYHNILKIVEPNNKSINFINFDYAGDGSEVYGRTFYDNYHDKVYCSVKHYRTYMDLISTVHELMHANQYYFNNKLLQHRFPLAGEIEPRVIELLMLDYLEENNHDMIEINKFRLWRNQQIAYAAYLILDYISRAKKENRLQDINYVNSEFVTALMGALTGLVAKYIYDEIKQNKEVGIAKLKVMMKYPLLLDEEPNFEHIGLSIDDMFEIARNLNNDFNRENIKEMKYNINR